MGIRARLGKGLDVTLGNGAHQPVTQCRAPDAPEVGGQGRAAAR